MIESFLISAFLIGVAGSAHCVGMCGPIALALPLGNFIAKNRLIALCLYNAGRIISYSLIGATVGFIGRQFFIAGYQQLLSIGLGVMMVAYFVWTITQREVLHLKAFSSLQMRLQNFIVEKLQNKTFLSSLLIGMANGLLPCGMVYFAVTGAMATGNIAYGLLFMLAFGAGTVPALFVFSYFGSFMKVSYRNQFKRSAPYIVAMMGAVFILRGMNLGIPYLSPYFRNHTSTVSCH